jgi:hypothetical protein
MARKEQADDEAWLDHEIVESEFQDIRLRKRFGRLCRDKAGKAKSCAILRIPYMTNE